MLELVTIKIILIANKFKRYLFSRNRKKLLGLMTNSKRCQLGILKYKNGSECSGGGWHVDRHTQFKVLLYVTDVCEDNGPFKIFSPLKSTDYTALDILGRQNTRFSDEIENVFKNRCKIINGNAGDVIMVDNYI